MFCTFNFRLQFPFKLWYRNVYRQIESPSANRQSFVILPEVPKHNKSLRLENFESFNFYDSFIDISKAVQNMEADISNVVIKSQGVTDSELRLRQIEDIISRLDEKFKYALLSGQISGNELEFEAYNILLNKPKIATHQLLYSPEMKLLIEDLLTKNLTAYSAPFVQRLALNCRIHGLHLVDEKRSQFEFHLKSVLMAQHSFISLLHKSQEDAHISVHREDLSDDTPISRLEPFASGKDGVFRFPLSDYETLRLVLTYCSNSTLRNQAWHTHHRLAGRQLYGAANSNHKYINEIRSHRSRMARLLGQPHYLGVLLAHQHRMVRDLSDIMTVLEQFKATLVPEAVREFEELNFYAASTKGLNDTLEQWDYDFVKRAFQQEVLLQCPASDLDAVKVSIRPQPLLHDLLQIVGQLYGLTFTTSKSSTAPQSQIEYDVTDRHGSLLSKVFVKITSGCPADQINVESFMHMDEAIDEVVKCTFINIRTREETLSHMRFVDLIKAVIIMLHHTFNRHNYGVTDFFNSLPPELLQINFHVLMQLLTSSKPVLQTLFPDADQSLLDELLVQWHRVLGQDNCDMAWDLYRAYFDIEMWVSDKDYSDIQKDLWTDLFGSNYFRVTEKNEWPCSASSIFTGHAWSGASLYGMFLARDYSDKVLMRAHELGFGRWSPGSVSMEPELRQLLEKYHKIFYEDVHLRPSSEMMALFLQ